MFDKKPLAIILSDYEKYGCPHCNNAPNMEAPLHHARVGGAISFDCSACQGKFVIAHDESERCPIGFLVEGAVEPFYPTMARHPKAPTRYLKHPDFERLASLASEKLPGDPARRHHVTETVKQLSDWARDCKAVGLAALGAAYEALGAESTQDPATAARRRTCRELAALCRQEDGQVSISAESKALADAAEIWAALAQAAASVQPADGRTLAMAERFQRELQQLTAIHSSPVAHTGIKMRC